jgi:hypothetical protein
MFGVRRVPAACWNFGGVSDLAGNRELCVKAPHRLIVPSYAKDTQPLLRGLSKTFT